MDVERIFNIAKCDKEEILNWILSITRHFFRLKLIQIDIDYDLKFRKKTSYYAKTPYFESVLCLEPLQFFIDATPVSVPHLLLVALCPPPSHLFTK